MSKILVSGLINIETTCSVGAFPVYYQPIDYNFFGQSMNVAGVGYNLTCALRTLGDDVTLASLIGNDIPAGIIRESVNRLGVKSILRNTLESTPLSVILYDRDGRRRIFCDLKDIQENTYDFSEFDLKAYDMAAVCNINFSRPLLRLAKSAGVKIASDVHVLGSVRDDYNREFMECADVLFLSNEAIKGREESFIRQLADTYGNEIIVIGCGGDGAVMYVRDGNRVLRQGASRADSIVNTVGAGDALFSCFISLYAKGTEPERCLRLAQNFAARKIGSGGASAGFCTMDELLTSM